MTTHNRKLPALSRASGLSAIVLLVAGSLAASGCKRADEPTPATPAATPTAAATMNPADLADVTASYACDEGNRVDIIRGAVARVGLSDGRVVKIEQIEGSEPRTFVHNGLTFVLRSENAADLSDNSNRTLQCRPASRPTLPVDAQPQAAP